MHELVAIDTDFIDARFNYETKKEVENILKYGDLTIETRSIRFMVPCITYQYETNQHDAAGQ